MTKVIEIGIKNWLLFISMMPIKILKFLTENLSKYEQFTLQRNLYKADTIGAKKMSALKRCSLNRFFRRYSLTAKQSNPFLVMQSVLWRCPLYSVSALQRFHCSSIVTLLLLVLLPLLSLLLLLLLLSLKINQDSCIKCQ